VLKACEAVAEANQLGIGHRDLKPSNLLLTKKSDGLPFLKVLDFGISKTHDEAESSKHLTTTTAVFGSPAYMSPEQIRSAKHVDARTDVWALAVVLFEILTGRLPFVGDTAAAILASVAADPPLPLRSYATLPLAVGASLQQAVEACLVKDRERRCPSVIEMTNLLAPHASTAGLRSVEAVRRIVSAPRPVPAAARSSSSPLASQQGSGFETTTELTPVGSSPSPVGPASGPNAVGRTDRGMVVASRRNLKSAPLLAGVGAAILLVAGITVTMLVQSRKHNQPVTVASPSTSEASPPVAASDPPPVPPSATATAVVVVDTAPTPPARVVPAPKGHGPGSKPHRVPPPPPVPAPPPASSSSPPRPTHVDTDSRQ